MEIVAGVLNKVNKARVGAADADNAANILITTQHACGVLSGMMVHSNELLKRGAAIGVLELVTAVVEKHKTRCDELGRDAVYWACCVMRVLFICCKASAPAARMRAVEAGAIEVPDLI